MANKASFTPDEWTKVMESVAVTGMAVTAADPSGLWGMLKEALAGGAALAAAKAEASTEGGFLGFGGVKVSDAEKATLGDIAKALGTTASA